MFIELTYKGWGKEPDQPVMINLNNITEIKKDRNGGATIVDINCCELDMTVESYDEIKKKIEDAYSNDKNMFKYTVAPAVVPKSFY